MGMIFVIGVAVPLVYGNEPLVRFYELQVRVQSTREFNRSEAADI